MRSQNQMASSMMAMGSNHLPMRSSLAARTRRASSGSSGNAAAWRSMVVMDASAERDRLAEHARRLAAEGGIFRRRPESLVARIGCVNRDLAEDTAGPRRHDDDAVGEENTLEHRMRDEDDGETLVLPEA